MMRNLVRMTKVLVYCCALALLGVSGTANADGGRAPLNPGKKVLAFYYTWYLTPEASGKWEHWNEGKHNPDKILENGFRDIGTTDHPVGGTYDSSEPALIRRHLELAQYCGIDALIATWWGPNNYIDTGLGKVLDEIEKTNSPVRVCAYYEIVSEPTVQGVMKDIEYAVSKYGVRPGYFKVDGRPVIFVTGLTLKQLGLEGWQEVTRIARDRKIVLLPDKSSEKWVSAFDGMHLYNPYDGPIVDRDLRQDYVKHVELARRLGIIATATVAPGCNDSNIGRPQDTVVGRRDGNLYREMWEGAIQSKPDWILITSFNEWHEGTEIEPSIEYGKKYIEMTKEYATTFKSSQQPD